MSGLAGAWFAVVEGAGLCESSEIALIQVMRAGAVISALSGYGPSLSMLAESDAAIAGWARNARRYSDAAGEAGASPELARRCRLPRTMRPPNPKQMAGTM